jgi:hypothetical protein
MLRVILNDYTDKSAEAKVVSFKIEDKKFYFAPETGWL